MQTEDHIAGHESDASVGVGVTVIQELVNFFFEACSGLGLACSDAAHGCNHGGVDGATVPCESADHVLDVLDFGRRDTWRRVRCDGLNLGSVLDGRGFRWGVLGAAWGWVLVFVEGFLDETRDMSV